MSGRLMVIDDEENIRLVARLALEADGYEGGEAASGMEAFAVLGHDASWDAIILDQKMPGLVGTEVLRRLSVLAPQARVIMAAETPAGPLIQIVTMNGFTILEAEEAQRAPDERRYKVRRPSGEEHEVQVKIEGEAVGYVERMTKRRLPAQSSFWTGQARRTLSNYLWSHGTVPSTGRLVVKDIDRDDLPMAARWPPDL